MIKLDQEMIIRHTELIFYTIGLLVAILYLVY